MKDRTTLTKSLHTVTVVANLAMYLQDTKGKLTDTEACRAALTVLGYDSQWTNNDTTFAACVAKVKTLRAKAAAAE